MSYKYILILLSLFSSCTRQKETPVVLKSIHEVYVKTAPVLKTAGINRIETMGIVASDSEAKPSFKTGGMIAYTWFSEGDLVKKGQLLARLHLTEIEAQVHQAEEALAKADRDVSRIQNLYRDSISTLEMYQNAQTAKEVAKQNYEMAKFNLRYSEVRSPIHGKIVKQLFHQGEMAGPGMPICVILGTQQKDWKISVGLIDQEWAQTEIGNPVDILLDAYPNQTFAGRIKSKSVLTDNQSGTFNVDIELLGKTPSLAMGMVSKVSILPKKSQTSVSIPIEALVESNGKTGKVFIIENGKAKSMGVTIAQIKGDRVTLSKGLENISEVITTGSSFTEEGDIVKKVN